MADDEEQLGESGLYASTAAARRRRNRHRKQAGVALAGAAAVVAGAGFLVTALLGDVQDAELPEPAALAPTTIPVTTAVTPSTASIDPRVLRTPEGFRPAEPVERSPVPSPVRSAEPAPGDPRGSAGGLAEQGNVGVSERTEALENGTIRIVTARRDLSGTRELTLAGDDGRLVGSGVRCTGDVRLPTGVPAERRPTVLLCWRTSAVRSVITMAVVPRGDWPTASSVAVIDREWDRLR